MLDLVHASGLSFVRQHLIQPFRHQHDTQIILKVGQLHPYGFERLPAFNACKKVLVISRLVGKPCLINKIELMSNIPIIRKNILDQPYEFRIDNVLVDFFLYLNKRNSILSRQKSA